MENKLKLLIKKLAGYYYSLFGSRDYKKFIIITRSRTGSNLLVSMLDSHANVACGYEVYSTTNGRTHDSIWHEFFNKKSKKIQCSGFKIFYYHPNDSEDDLIWKIIKEDKSIKIIHLVRKNLLQVVTSQKIAQVTNQWVQKSGTKKKSIDPIILSIDECEKQFETTNNYELSTKKQFSDHEFIELSYEDLVSKRDMVMAEIFEFLDVANMEVNSPLKKQNTNSLDKQIANYSELKQHFEKSKWGHFFE